MNDNYLYCPKCKAHQHERFTHCFNCGAEMVNKQPKTRAEVDDLKAQWKADPCWDIEFTEGFEDHIEELRQFQELTNKIWENEERARLYTKSFSLKCSVELIQHIERLEERLERLIKAGQQ